MKICIYQTVFIMSFLAASSSGFARGVGGGGGSPPSILLPSQQFKEITLGILRGEKIQLRSDDSELKFDATSIDPRIGTITIVSPENGEKFILQDYDKKFGNSSILRPNLFKSTSNGKSPIPSIPINPDVTTIPADDEGGIGGGGSPPSSESEVDAGH